MSASDDTPAVIVVGAGIAGVACARELHEAGIAVRVLDRGRAIGGRMASRRFDGRPADLGASYFTASDPAFVAVVESWRDRGLARPWTDTFTALDAADGSTEPKTGPMRWGAAHGLRSLVEDLATGLGEGGVERAEVERVTLGADAVHALEVDHRPARAVVLAMPDAQALRLLDPALAQTRAALTRESEPTLALMARFATRAWDDDLDGVFVNHDPDLSWIADDGRRRGDDAPVLVAHSTPDLAARHLDDADLTTTAGPVMLAALRRLLSIEPDAEASFVQRWSLAKPTGEREAPWFLGLEGVGVCGDGWGPTSKVETAFLSGRALGMELASRLRG